MKRQTKFRGKRVDNGKWVIGDSTASTIMVGCIFVHIIPESVGQFTGLQDKNGVDIYEGDIIGRKGFFNRVIKTDRIGFIEYSVNNINDVRRLELESLDEYDEIIGNIYDNPELI